MKFLKSAMLGAALAGCLSCVETDPRLGGDLIPVDQQYEIYSVEIPIEDVQMKMADSLSGYSSSRITIGAIRDDLFGLSTKSSAITLIPLYDTLDFGAVQDIVSFHLSAAFDTTSVSRTGDERILQNVYVNKIEPGVEMAAMLDANDVAGKMKHGSESIVKGSPIIDGACDLELDFTDSFAWDFINAAQGMILSEQFKDYLDKFPGIYISTDAPAGNGGRINTFDLQMNYNTSYYYLESNFASLEVSSIFDDSEEAVDTTFYFYYGALEFHDLDSLVSDYSNGTYPEYAINLDTHSTRSYAGPATDKVLVEGGAGIKPVIPATSLKQAALAAIRDTIMAHGFSADDASTAIINKASLIMPFEMPDDYTDVDNYFPPRLTPTCRIRTDTTSTFMGLTDSSSEDEDQGDINRSILVYQPDITYHLQQILLMDDDNEYLNAGNYDIWLLLMNLEETTSSSSTSSDYSEYLQYLAYQSYYNSMYGGYGGYSSYGYGSSSSYYSNYYSYMLAAMYASGSTTTSTDYELDQDLYYRATLDGPKAERHPTMKIVFSIPKK